MGYVCIKSLSRSLPGILNVTQPGTYESLGEADLACSACHSPIFKWLQKSIFSGKRRPPCNIIHSRSISSVLYFSRVLFDEGRGSRDRKCVGEIGRLVLGIFLINYDAILLGTSWERKQSTD